MTTSPPHWLSGVDVTTVANRRSTSVVEDGDRPGRQRRRPSSDATGGLVFLAAMWLTISSFSLYYRDTGRYDAFWNGAVVGLAIAVLFLVRVVRPAETTSLGWVTAAMGGWLVAAPFVLDFSSAENASLTVWNDIVVGVLVLVLSLLGLLPADAAVEVDR